jgi:hypothetical protein
MIWHRRIYFHSLLHIHRIIIKKHYVIKVLRHIVPDQKSALSAVGTSESFPL